MACSPDAAPPARSPDPPHLQLVPSRFSGVPQPCLRCGGSGVLRTDAAGFRTCLDCVGQGAPPRPELAAALEPARRVQGRPPLLPLPGGELSVWLTSGAR